MGHLSQVAHFAFAQETNMALTVKPGREYVLGGKVYKDGADVPEDQIPAKYKSLLTSAKGPLSAGPVKSPTDLPKATLVQQEPPKEAPDTVEEAADIEEAAPEAPVDPRTDTRDVRATGRTGQVRPSRSSHPAHRREKKS
jgi:hypothetical protein